MTVARQSAKCALSDFLRNLSARATSAPSKMEKTQEGAQSPRAKSQISMCGICEQLGLVAWAKGDCDEEEHGEEFD